MSKMLNLIEGILKDITYKKGWCFKAQEEISGIITVKVFCQAENINPPHGIGLILRSMEFDKDSLKRFNKKDNREFINYLKICVYGRIKEIEDHEREEWFKYKGVQVFTVVHRK